jgi:steroid delta-isomerase-like uncharacterized protein
MDPRDVVQQFYDLAWNQGRLNDAAELLAPDLADHDPAPLPPGSPTGAAALLAVVGMIRAGVGDLARTIELQVADGDLVATRFRDRGTHSGDLLGIPATGRTIDVTGINIERVRDGRIVELWHVEDIAGLMAQIGTR